jgi:hypothetical protein
LSLSPLFDLQPGSQHTTEINFSNVSRRQMMKKLLLLVLVLSVGLVLLLGIYYFIMSGNSTTTIQSQTPSPGCSSNRNISFPDAYTEGKRIKHFKF